MKSKTGLAPASRISQISLPDPVPVILAAPTFLPESTKPLIRLAAVVVLPEFIELPTTAIVKGRFPM